MSTLVEELEQAATRAEVRAQETTDARDGVRWKLHRDAHLAEAARLRKRVEHVKRLRNEMPSKADIELFDALTGRLP